MLSNSARISAPSYSFWKKMKRKEDLILIARMFKDDIIIALLSLLLKAVHLWTQWYLICFIKFSLNWRKLYILKAVGSWYGGFKIQYPITDEFVTAFICIIRGILFVVISVHYCHYDIVGSCWFSFGITIWIAKSNKENPFMINSLRVMLFSIVTYASLTEGGKRERHRRFYTFKTLL